jgi:hypothetical protein
MKRKVYVVRRLSWSASYEGGCFEASGYEDIQPGVPVRVFADRKAAEAFCREQEATARQLVPPGRVLGLSGGKDPKKIVASIRRLGLKPPKLGEWLDGAELLRWWKSVAAEATPEQRAEVWDLLGVRFFDVVESPLEG